MFRYKFTAMLISLLARLGLADPQYSILDESSNRWLPNDSFLTGLNTIYSGLSNGLLDSNDKKRRSASVIVAAIIEYLSSDLADEQAKLNSTLNALTKRINLKSKVVISFTGVKVIKNVAFEQDHNGDKPANFQNDNKVQHITRILDEDNEDMINDSSFILNDCGDESLILDFDNYHKLHDDYKEFSDEVKYSNIHGSFSMLPL